MPTLKGTEASLSYVQYFLYLVFLSINASIFHITWLDTFWTDLVYIGVYVCVCVYAHTVTKTETFNENRINTQMNRTE